MWASIFLRFGAVLESSSRGRCLIKHEESPVSWMLAEYPQTYQTNSWLLPSQVKSGLFSLLGGVTLFLGRTCDGVFEGLAAGVVASTHSTIVLLLWGADDSVTSHFLLARTCGVWHMLISARAAVFHAAHVTPLTLHSPPTQTLCGSLYEHRVPSMTTVSVKTTVRVSLDWQCK